MDLRLPRVLIFDADGTLRLLRDTVEAAIGFVPDDAAIDVCVCDPREPCPCRKPAPGSPSSGRAPSSPRVLRSSMQISMRAGSR